jgi:uncharacterized membrane protein YgcG
MNELYDVLELCLQEIEKGTDIETVLSRYPKHADELRPILETSVQAIRLAPMGPSPEVERRGRAKVLQQAALLREAQAQPSRRLWSVPLRRALVTLTVIGVLFISSTRLVQAASTTLPGDNLYPVKRTWEDVRVLFTFDNQAREALEVEHENERLDELNNLFTEGRSAKVDFAGTVMSQNGDLWEVAKIPVLISAQTEMGTQPVVVGNAVRVKGYTQQGGTVMAERVDLLPAGMPLPEVDDDHAPAATGQEKSEGEQQQPSSVDDNSNEGSGDGASRPEATQAPQEESKSREFSRSGVVDAVNGSTLVVNGQSINISTAKIEGTPKVGAKVKVEGYFDANGIFIVTKIEFENGGSDGGGSVSDNGDKENDSQDNSNDNGSHEDSNGNGNEDDNSNSGGSSGGGGDD